MVDFLKEPTEVLGAIRQFLSETGAVYVLSDGLMIFQMVSPILGQVPSY